MVVVPIAKYFAHRDAQELWQQEQKKSKRIKSEMDNFVKYNVKGKIVNVKLDDECIEAHAVIRHKLNTSELSPIGLLRASLLYKCKYMVVDYCAEENMTDYVKAFDTTFGTLYNNSVNLLNSLTDNKGEQCIIRPMFEVYSGYFNVDMDDVFYTTRLGLAKASNGKIILTKTEFCNRLNTDTELVQKAWFNTCRKNLTAAESSFSLSAK